MNFFKEKTKQLCVELSSYDCVAQICRFRHQRTVRVRIQPLEIFVLHLFSVHCRCTYWPFNTSVKQLISSGSKQCIRPGFESNQLQLLFNVVLFTFNSTEKTEAKQSKRRPGMAHFKQCCRKTCLGMPPCGF